MDVTGSTFSGNSAGQNGGVAYFRSMAASPASSMLQLIAACTGPDTSTCPAAGNSATRWGNTLSLDIVTLGAVVPNVTRPGVGLNAYVTLYDGARAPARPPSPPALLMTRLAPWYRPRSSSH